MKKLMGLVGLTTMLLMFSPSKASNNVKTAGNVNYPVGNYLLDNGLDSASKVYDGKNKTINVPQGPSFLSDTYYDLTHCRKVD